jgi:GDP-D-mannose 3',5'-epimerase
MKKALVLGSSGFIGHHLVRDLRGKGWYVIGIDLETCVYKDAQPDIFYLQDLRTPDFWTQIDLNSIDRVYQLAADMGGAGYVFSGQNDAQIMTNSSLINLNFLSALQRTASFQGVIFFASSACVYPLRNQLDPGNPYCEESSAYPAEPDSEYGWEKLYAERLYQTYSRNFGYNIKIARFHNIYGPECDFSSGKEKAPAAICRKVLEAAFSGKLQIWGDGKQTRTFLYIDDCLNALELLLVSPIHEPINIGSQELVSINELAAVALKLEQINAEVAYIDGPTGVVGRSSHNVKIFEELNWVPTTTLELGIYKLLLWMKSVQFNN